MPNSEANEESELFDRFVSADGERRTKSGPALWRVPR